MINHILKVEGKKPKKNPNKSVWSMTWNLTRMFWSVYNNDFYHCHWRKLIQFWSKIYPHILNLTSTIIHSIVLFQPKKTNNKSQTWYEIIIWNQCTRSGTFFFFSQKFSDVLTFSFKSIKHNLRFWNYFWLLCITWTDCTSIIF